jgi:hypothetical protein
MAVPMCKKRKLLLVSNRKLITGNLSERMYRIVSSIKFLCKVFSNSVDDESEEDIDGPF